MSALQWLFYFLCQGDPPFLLPRACRELCLGSFLIATRILNAAALQNVRARLSAFLLLTRPLRICPLMPTLLQHIPHVLKAGTAPPLVKPAPPKGATPALGLGYGPLQVTRHLLFCRLPFHLGRL
jgi:hypothetical protein